MGEQITSLECKCHFRFFRGNLRNFELQLFPLEFLNSYNLLGNCVRNVGTRTGKIGRKRGKKEVGSPSFLEKSTAQRHARQIVQKSGKWMYRYSISFVLILDIHNWLEANGPRLCQSSARESCH